MAKNIATRIEDEGVSRLAGKIVPKDSAIIEILGRLDSFNTSLDLCKIHITDEQLRLELTALQRKFALLAGVLVGYTPDNGTIFTQEDITRIQIKAKEVEPRIPNEFVSFQTLAAHSLNDARVRVRDLERVLVPLLRSGELDRTYYKFINGLSIYLFCLAVECSEPEGIKSSLAKEKRL